MATEKDQEFVEYLAKQLVEKPEAVKVVRSVDEMGVLLELTVDKDDMGVVIGKEGKTAKSIRTLLRVLGAKNDARVNLKIVEPEGSERPAPKEEVKEEKAEPKEEVEEEVEEAPAEPVVEEDDDERPMADLDL
jgi:predicted RNA-binding protein YlqC (UPF0109 family)